MNAQFVTAGNLRMHYLEAGDGPPVICIHGWPESAAEWLGVGERLSPQYRILAPDTRGHGRTAAPEQGYDRAQLARDIVNFMDALGIDQCPVIGHDWGGIIAVKLALDHGERVSKLALLDTICTGWFSFVQYYYWFMDGDRAERFFATRARDFIRSVVGGRATGLPPPPECPMEFQSPELTAPVQWASEATLDGYIQPYEQGPAGRVSCAYYRDLHFHRVIADAAAPHGERYEAVPHTEMGRMWREQEIALEYLDFAPEDRHKTYGGDVLWAYSQGVVEAAGGSLNDADIPTGDPGLDSFSRHFPRLVAKPMEGGHFFVEAEPEATSQLIQEFLSKG